MDDVEVDPNLVSDKLDTWLDGFFKLNPNIAIALAVLLLVWLIGLGVSKLINRLSRRGDRSSLGKVGGSLADWQS